MFFSGEAIRNALTADRSGRLRSNELHPLHTPIGLPRCETIRIHRRIGPTAAHCAQQRHALPAVLPLEREHCLGWVFPI